MKLSHRRYTCIWHVCRQMQKYLKDILNSLQLPNWILDSGATCHTTPYISDFIPGLLVATDKYIKVADGNFVTAKQIGEAQTKIGDDNGKTVIYTLYNAILAPDLCDRLFYIITLMYLGHTYLLHKRF